ncbi:MAG: D-glycerate dehydrogenase [Actinobacteria bacterium]|nr:D-glycerate dehydrogenase [Actinomycetota bacterium]
MRVLASRRFPGPAWDALDDVGVEWPVAGPRPGVEVLAVVAATVDDELLELLPDLRLVAGYGVGYDEIDVEACARRGVAVTNTPDALGTATADLTMALVLGCRRRIVEGDRFVREGRWASGWVVGELLGDEIGDATLGIVGLGRIGSAVATRARAFGINVLHTRREDDGSREFRELDDLLRESDVVTLHVPLTAETHGLLDARRLALLRDGACLINTARGAIVDEDALVAELASRRLRAGLDVFVQEPDVPQALLDLPNVVLSPHVGSATRATREAATAELVANILAALERRPLPNPVPGSATVS